MPNRHILICGDVMVDVHLQLNNKGMTSLQLGGVFHSARALSALKQSYGLGFMAPSYLKENIYECASKLNVKEVFEFGSVDCAPNVILIGEPTEAGNQGYIELLGTQKKSPLNWQEIKKNDWADYTDVLIYPGAYDWVCLTNFFQESGKDVHIDLQYVSSSEIKELQLVRGLNTLFLSTSSPVFSDICKKQPDKVAELATDCCQRVILKENRGGSRLFRCADSKWISVPCYPIQCLHSVGVGDCYNAAFLASLRIGCSEEVALNRASLSAAFYAGTLDFTELDALLSCLSEVDIDFFDNIRLPWEKRQDIHIYLAGPDFPNVDTSLIDKVERNLKYHNFSTHRPIQENGLITGRETESEELRIFQNDIQLLKECDLLVAISLTEDSGTMAELGYFRQMQKPAILFDPLNKIDNMFVQRIVNRVCYNFTELTEAVFAELGGQRNDQ